MMDRMFLNSRFRLTIASWSGDTRRFQAVVLILAMALSALAAISLNQLVNWDLKNYHLYGAFAFLKKPLHYDFAPAQVQSFFNPLLHIPTYLALEYLPGAVSLGLIGAIQGINFFLLFRIAQSLFTFFREPFRTFLSLCCAFTGFYGAANLGELGTTFADNMLSIPVLAGLLLLIRYILREKTADPPPRLLPILAGALIGAVLGLKLNMAPYAFAAFVAFLAVTAVRKEGIRPVLYFSGSIALAFLCVYGFWGTTLYLEYKNPFFPYLNEIFKSPYYDFTSANDPRFLPRNWQQTFFYPFFFAHRNHLTCEVQFRDIRFAVCYAAILLLAAFGMSRFLRGSASPKHGLDGKRGASLVFLALFFVISYVAWQQLFSIQRYLIPLELLAPVLLTLILFYISRRPALTATASLILCACIIVSLVPITFGRGGAAYESLKFNPPRIDGLKNSVILMTGGAPTAYIALRFPAETRFVRISSNFGRPGQNRLMDERIQKTLNAYGESRILAYFESRGDIQEARDSLLFYGLGVDEASCLELRSSSQSHGVLCRTFAVKKSGQSASVQPRQ